ncbi:unnamed protein product [Pocillopora meandrina]|uniref:Uncharacterized protein n=1 Tax=Pocillopora meandrina TaxID=46732 RepID=A0AAU9WD51_9CNID|nr:unnamed protein product [Pocillopora meandrina]
MHDLWPKVVEETKTRNSLELCSWQRLVDCFSSMNLVFHEMIK